MSKTSKILKYLGIALLVLLVLNTIRLQHNLTKAESSKIQSEQIANLEIGRAHTTVQDAESKIKQMDLQIQQDVRDKQAIADSYAILDAKYNQKGSGTLIVHVPGPPVPGPIQKIYLQTDTGPIQLTTLPFEYSDFRLHISGDAITKQYNYSLTQEFEVQILETKLKNGTHNHYAELYELDTGGKRVNKLTLTKFEVIDTETAVAKRMKWFDWHIDLGVNYDFYSLNQHGIAGELGISMMSYGRPGILDWRFVRGSIGLDTKGVYVGLSPIQYNIGNPLPLFTNLWLTPQLMYNLDAKSYALGFGISVIL